MRPVAKHELSEPPSVVTELAKLLLLLLWWNWLVSAQPPTDVDDKPQGLNEEISMAVSHQTQHKASSSGQAEVVKR
jgi:hypothetical protein